MIQPILSSSESVESDLSVFLNSAESSYDASYIGVALLERVSIDPDDLQHKMLVGRLWNSGARLNALQKTGKTISNLEMEVVPLESTVEELADRLSRAIRQQSRIQFLISEDNLKIELLTGPVRT